MQDSKLSFKSKEAFQQLLRQFKADAYPLSESTSFAIDQAAERFADEIASFMPFGEEHSNADQNALSQKISLLQNVPLFMGIDPDGLRQIAERLQELKLSAGAEFLTQDEPAGGVFFIKDGHVEILVNQELVAQRSTGDSIGEMSCLREETNASATARCATNCTIWKITRPAFLDAVNLLPDLWRKVFHEMTDRFQEVSARKSELIQHSNEGLLKIDAKGVVTDEYSIRCTELFGIQNLQGRSVSELIFQDPAQGAEFLSVLPLFFETNLIDFSSIAALLPKEIIFNHPKGEQRYYRFSFYPCWALNKSLTAIDMGVQDITEEKRLAIKRQQLEQEKASLQCLYDDPDAYMQLLKMVHDIETRLQQVEEYATDTGKGPKVRPLLLRKLHTLKGTAGMFSLHRLGKVTHDLETFFTALLDQNEQHFDLKNFAVIKEQFSSSRNYAFGLLASISPELKRRLTGVVLSLKDFEQLKTCHSNHDSAGLGKLLEHIQAVPAQKMVQSWPEEIDRLSETLHKKVKFSVSGDTILVSQPLYHALSPLLVHILRNSMDHGIEAPEVRQQAGKDEFGRLKVHFTGNETTLQIAFSDDGQGIDYEKLIAKARQDQKLNQDEIEAAIQKGEPWRILLLNGISSKEEISQISGRGIGLGAVADQIQQMKGSFKIESERNEGTRFSLELPLDL